MNGNFWNCLRRRCLATGSRSRNPRYRGTSRVARPALPEQPCLPAAQTVQNSGQPPIQQSAAWSGNGDSITLQWISRIEQFEQFEQF